jgi:signal transduction histidine kinase
MDAMSPEASTIGGDQSLEELRRELAEAREQQAATAEILRVISSSPTDLQRVFAEIAEGAARLCDAYDASIHRVDGDLLPVVAHHGPIPTTGMFSLTRGFFIGRAVLDLRTIHIADLQAETDEYPEGSERARRLGFRSILAVPLMRAGEAIGVISLRRTEVRPFTDRQIELLKTFADQAVIAIENTRLFEEVRQKNTALTEANTQLTEALEQQTATAEILRVISSSPTKIQPVLDTVAENSARLCDADDAQIYVLKDSLLVRGASYGPIPPFGKREVDRGSLTGRAVVDRRTIHVYDLAAESDAEYPIGKASQRVIGHRTTLATPLLREGVALGAILIRRMVVRPFSERQIKLLKIFADQAVIAIENTRLFEAEQERTRELQERTNELTDALEYQTATSGVLSVISSSPTNIQPVYDKIAIDALKLCGATWSSVLRFDGELIRIASLHNLTDARGLEAIRSAFPRAPRPGGTNDQAILTGTIAYVPDVLEDSEYKFRDLAQATGYRSHLSVPMLQDGRPVGAITVAGASPGAFSSRQIALLQTFADQAVIAIENARLFEAEQARTRELTEALEQQTATADVLKVISRSAFDVKRVLDALVETAARLCDAYDAAIYQVFGDALRLVAHHGPIPIGPVGHLLPLVRGLIGARVVIDRRTIQVADLLAEGWDEYPESRKRALQLGYRTMLVVPLVHAGEAIGVLYIRRAEVRPFTERQIELVNTFADQAVIAIENTRLFEAEQARTRELAERTQELTEALEYQTATSDVLNVISQSKFDLQPVLDSIVETAARLCTCDMATIRRREGDVYVQLAGYGLPTDYAEYSRSASWHHAGRGSLVGRVLQEGRAVQIPDVLADPDYTLDEVQRRGGFRSTLGVPLLHGADQIGIIVLMRRVVQPFSNKQIELVTAFADQAVIAIENARLFEEVQARTRELAKTVEDLEIASQHKSQFVANMSHELRTPLAAILGYAELIQEGFYGPLSDKALESLTRIRSNGKHLLGLINTVLDIAKIESGQFTLNMADYTIESVVETVRSATESLAQNKKLLLTTEVARSLPIGLGDEQRLTQVLLNLVGNAIKFTDTGEVRVTAKSVNGHFAVSVTDTGPGIPDEHRARIFEQFHQVDSSNTKAKGGTGLGLAIAKQIVEMHGGRIWVESAVGKGSTFRMENPARAEVARSG